MGGSGSGPRRLGPDGEKLPVMRPVEECWQISIYDFHRAGALRPWGPVPGTVTLPGSGPSEELKIEFTANDSGVLFRRPGGEPYLAAVAWLPLPIRPEKKWPRFLCPGRQGTPCGARVVKLYMPLPPGEMRFLCRECHSLTYEIDQQSGRPLKLARKRLRNWQRKLGQGDADILSVSVAGGIAVAGC